jgi:hypothetical protein
VKPEKQKPSLARKLVAIMLELAEAQKKQRAQSCTDADWAAHYMRNAIDALLAISPDRSRLIRVTNEQVVNLLRRFLSDLCCFHVHYRIRLPKKYTVSGYYHPD